MTERFEYLHRDRTALATIARTIRERRTTAPHVTVVTPLRWWVALTLTLWMAACGGGKRSDTYAKGTDVQRQCCESLTGPARDSCLSEIVRLEDADAAKTSTNQATYACVVEHFVCDPATGRPTQASAQAQYDCIEDQAR